ncbi:unnamed protein product [Hydatigera taeniaeformis]|uniref:Uncharacterized protein n=1 Tax=Hydatigena taeniaeformis TaxID=6205 RepID=A0A0R3WJ90_HYDTA|nr:unnamed protein product [Hydatigera taeniaeformis]
METLKRHDFRHSDLDRGGMTYHSLPQTCNTAEIRLCDSTDFENQIRNWVPLRDVLQGEGNYGPKALFYTSRDTFVSASAPKRVDLGGGREDPVMAKRLFNLETIKRQEARSLSTALLCLRRERLCQVLRCDSRRDEQHQPCHQASTLSSIISALPPLLPLVNR